jgi:polyhydroxyalkanoate synthesis regulator phasin
MNDENYSEDKTLPIVELLVLGSAAALSAIIAILDFVGVLSRIPWLSERVSTLTLLLLALVATYILVERRKHFDKHDRHTKAYHMEVLQSLTDSTSTIIASVSGVQIKSFYDNTKLVEYIAKRLKEAKHTVDDLTWSHRLSLVQHLPAQKKVEEKYQQRIGEISQYLQYREVFIFNKVNRFDKLKRRIEENASGYSCAYYRPTVIPLMQFVIIDGEEIIFAGDVFPSKCAIRSPQLATVFQSYYDEVWQHATKLKQGHDVNKEEVQKVLAETIPDQAE